MNINSSSSVASMQSVNGVNDKDEQLKRNIEQAKRNIDEFFNIKANDFL